LSPEGMQWFFSVMIDIPMNEVRGDPLARQERRKQKKDAAREAPPEEEVADEPEFDP